MAGYTRTDTTNNIANGNVINANDLDSEYNAVEAAFNASSGHKHDGTAAEGAPITKVGPSQDLIVSSSSVLPKTPNTLDLGSVGVQFKDGYFDGVLYADSSRHGVNGLTSIGDNVYTVSSGGLSVDVAGDITLNPTGLDVVLASAGTPYGSLTNTSNNLTIKSGTTTAVTLTGANTQLAGTLGVAGNSTIGGTLGVTGAITGALTGNASTASALATTRTITLGGDLNGTINFNGSQDVSATIGVNDDSHNHTQANVDGLVAALGSINSTNSSQASSISSINSTLGGKVANTRNITAGGGLTGGGTLAADRTISHSDTSSQGSVDNSGTTFIQDITLDTYGHITSIGSATVSSTDTTYTAGTNISLSGTTFNLDSTIEGISYIQNNSNIKIDANGAGKVILDADNDGVWFTDPSGGHAGQKSFYISMPNDGHITMQPFLSGQNVTLMTQTEGDMYISSRRGMTLSVGHQSSTGQYNDTMVLQHRGSAVSFIKPINATGYGFEIYTKGSNHEPSNGVLNTRFSSDDITCQGSVNALSDVRVKENIETISNGLSLVTSLRGVTYNKIGREKVKVGVIAQEVEEVLPHVVTTDEDGMKAVDYGNMVAVLIEAVKELEARIVELEA